MKKELNDQELQKTSGGGNEDGGFSRPLPNKPGDKCGSFVYVVPRYCPHCGEVLVRKEKETCPNCGSPLTEQA